MAKYVMRENPGLLGEGARRKVPKMVVEHQYSLRDLAEEIAKRSMFSVGEVEGLMLSVADALAGRIADGYSVKIDGLGSFSAKLGLKKGAELRRQSGSMPNAASIEIAGLNFRADKELLRRANNRCRLVRTKGQKYADPTEGKEERLEMLLGFLERHSCISLQQYAVMTRMSKRSARKELGEWESDKRIFRRGKGPSLIFLRAGEDFARE